MYLTSNIKTENSITSFIGLLWLLQQITSNFVYYNNMHLFSYSLRDQSEISIQEVEGLCFLRKLKRKIHVLPWFLELYSLYSLTRGLFLHL